MNTFDVGYNSYPISFIYIRHYKKDWKHSSICGINISTSFSGNKLW